jgi:sarcosine oxidase gamma subunit
MAITVCPEKLCRRPFQPSETTCADCGATKPERTVHLACVGAPRNESDRLEDVIDAQLNSATFAGLMSMRMQWLGPGQWRLVDVAHQPEGRVAILSRDQCEALIRMALQGTELALQR